MATYVKKLAANAANALVYVWTGCTGFVALSGSLFIEGHNFVESPDLLGGLALVVGSLLGLGGLAGALLSWKRRSRGTMLILVYCLVFDTILLGIFIAGIAAHKPMRTILSEGFPPLLTVIPGFLLSSIWVFWKYCHPEDEVND